MTLHFTIKIVAACALLTGATASFSQHIDSHAGHQAPLSPYAGQQSREIKALSEAQTQDILAGKGMELAKAAELNGYPGPMHALELADPLQLTPAQRAATTQLLNLHKSEVRVLGRQLVEAERHLDYAFASQQIDAENLTRLTQQIGQLQAAVRNAHLQTHLRQTRLLTVQQVTQYQMLRGYGSNTFSPP